MPKPIFVILVVALLAGGGSASPPPHSLVSSDLNHERDRREFWQGLAYFACSASLVLLIVGVAIGSSAIRKGNGGPHA
jgi:hypothetical protein